MRLAVPGLHMVTNAAAAIAVAGIVGVDLGGSHRRAVDGHRVGHADGGDALLPSGATIVNDAYNANPTSMRAALDALAAMRADRHVAVLGLMAEIEDPEPAHRRIAEYAHELGIELIAVGTRPLRDRPDRRRALPRSATWDGDVAVLVKASRAAGLERVVAALTER